MGTARSSLAMTEPSCSNTLVEAVGRRDAAGARLVLHDDGRIAGNVMAEIARHEAGRNVVDAAGCRADHHGDLPAFVELLDRLGARRSPVVATTRPQDRQSRERATTRIAEA